MADKIIGLLEGNGVDLKDALFYLSTYLQDQEVAEND